jgi:DNA-binding beta-propeller fold protein YncE
MTQQSPRSRVQVATLLVAVALLVPAPLVQAGTLYGFSDVFNQVYAIDTATGLATVIGGGDIGDILLSSGVGGLAYDPDTDTLYMSNAAELWTIDPTTGLGTVIGPHGLPDLITGITVRPDPCMVGLDLTSRLYDIDPGSGAGSNTRVMSETKFGGLGPRHRQ